LFPGCLQHHRRQAIIVGIHIGLFGIGELRRLLVCTLAEPNRRLTRQQHLQILLAAVKIGLDHEADVRKSLLSQRVLDLQRAIHGGGILHVDSHESAELSGPAGDAAHISQAEIVIHRQSQLRELQRAIGGNPGLIESLQNVDIGVCGTRGLLGIRHTLSQMIEGGEETGGVEVPDNI